MLTLHSKLPLRYYVTKINCHSNDRGIICKQCKTITVSKKVKVKVSKFFKFLLKKGLLIFKSFYNVGGINGCYPSLLYVLPLSVSDENLSNVPAKRNLKGYHLVERELSPDFPDETFKSALKNS